jgi:hypothetical protein
VNLSGGAIALLACEEAARLFKMALAAPSPDPRAPITWRT